MNENGYTPGPRRQLVLDLLKRGKTVREIAKTLDIAVPVAYRHVHALEERGLWEAKAS